MANICFSLIVLSVCVACTFATGTPSFLKNDIIVYGQRDHRMGGVMFVEKDGANPMGEGNLDLLFTIKPTKAAYNDVLRKLKDNGLNGPEYGELFTFTVTDLQITPLTKV
ncbi:uncharacterized protein LOC126833637 [Adelges cooleyi]|uniref:uncharacterized protein LOC126833637 n=1 Tax=Adelges cooleyi TaxID=133065 RepID=UPI00217FA9AB|nr:uncharacterized protein LOC126833637 [Adelges cooleyi]